MRPPAALSHRPPSEGCARTWKISLRGRVAARSPWAASRHRLTRAPPHARVPAAPLPRPSASPYPRVQGEAASIEAAAKSDTPEMVEHFYNLVTDLYEWGWGQSFHFSPGLRGHGLKVAEGAHECRIADALQLRPGLRCLDMGCGVGGPMRTIAAHGQCEVVGVTINGYQVKRCEEHNRRLGLQEQCSAVRGNFLDLPFPDASFDAAYAIEATCHAPKLEEVYAEAFRVLKPGGRFAVFEWVTTDKFDPANKEHVACVAGINKGNGLPEMRSSADVARVAREVGFEVLQAWDPALPPALPWYTRLKMGAFQHNVNSALLAVLETVRAVPKGTAEVAAMLAETGRDLTWGGEQGIFTPMFFCVMQKPHAGRAASAPL